MLLSERIASPFMRRIWISVSPLAAVLLMAASVGRGGALELPPAMIEGLKSEKFAARESAEAELLEWSRQQPGDSMDELYRQSRAAPDPEVRERCNGVLRELINDEYVRDGVGYLGVGMDFFTRGVQVPGENKPRFAIGLTQIQPETPAAKARLLPGDLLLEVGGTILQEGNSFEFVSDVIQDFKPGSKVILKLLRRGEVVEIPVVLARRPPAEEMRIAGFPIDREREAARDNEVKAAYFRRWLARKKEAAK